MVAFYLSNFYNNSIILSKGEQLIRLLCRIIRKESMYQRIWFHQYQEIDVLYDHLDTIVYLTQHVKLLSFCIIKQINKSARYCHQAYMEVKLLRMLKHKGIPVLYQCYETEDAIYLIEEYKEGETLSSICQTQHLSYLSILSYGIQLCNILHYLHTHPEPILHLDVNPNNIILHENQLSLIDFSAAIKLEEARAAKLSFGTLAYAAPEQICGKGLDFRTDIFAFGKTLDFMLDHMEERDRFHLEGGKLKRIVRNCTHNIKLSRYRSIQQVGSLLSQLYESELGKDPKKELDCVVTDMPNRLTSNDFELWLSSYLRHRKNSSYQEKYNRRTVVKWMRRNLKAKNLVIPNPMIKLGVFSLHPHAGATYVTILLAEYLRNVVGYKTMVVDQSQRKDLLSLAKDSPLDANTQVFEHHNITFSCVNSHDLIGGDLYQSDFCVYDLGSCYGRAREQILSCDVTILLFSMTPWYCDMTILDELMTKDYGEKRRLHLLGNQVPQELQKKLRKNFHCEFLDYEPNMYLPSLKTVELFHRICSKLCR